MHYTDISILHLYMWGGLKVPMISALERVIRMHLVIVPNCSVTFSGGGEGIRTVLRNLTMKY